MKSQRILFTILFLSASTLVVHAYDPATHRVIGERSATSPISLLDDILKTELGFTDGVAHGLVGISRPEIRRIEQLIGDGAESEDVPAIRGLNHFHNPLIDPWDGAGLRAAPLLGIATVRGQSSVLWQQNADQDSTLVFMLAPLPSGGGTWTWATARDRYLEALTNPTKADQANQRGRDTAFAELFENLGHLTHVVQDATVPAHTRNDAHPTLIRPDFYEAWAQQNPAIVQGLINATPTKPSLSIFTATGNPQAPVPIARLIDTDTFLGTNASVLTSANPLIGIGEYTNGNFLSLGTRFRDFTLPQPSSLDVGEVVEAKPGKFRRYFRKARDGAAIEHFATEGMLYDSQVAARGAPLPTSGWMLDQLIHRDYAAELLPRAVGYSSALLDYFFRGRLDVGLADDAGAARVVGTNASDEPLSNGALFVYAENAAGTRALASSPEGVMVNAASAKGGVLPDVPLTTVPADTERFVAVYKGGLGSEQPTGTAPGAVIGKVFGGVRVEEIFSAGNQWKMRSPKGVFTLTDAGQPLSASFYEEVRWGDADNVIVARRPLDASTLEHLVVYDVPRQAGSADVVVEPSTLNVPLVRRLAVPFPFGTVLTTLHASISVDYRQRLGRSDFKRKYTWIEVDPPGESFYTPPEDDYPPFTFEIAHEETVPFIQAIPVALDLDHNYNLGTTGDPYSWDLTETFVDAQGRILGLVVAYLGNGPQTSVPVFSVDALTGGLVHVADRAILPYLPPQFSPLLWALVDLGQGTVVASTADSDVAMNFRRVEEFGLQESFWYHLTEQYDGGPQNGLHDRGWFRAVTIDYLRNEGTLGSVTDVTFPTVGDRETEVDGWLLADLLQAVVARGLYTPFPIEVPGGTQFVYYCDMSKVCKAMLIDEPSGLVVDDPGQFWEARRTLPVAGNERLVLLSLRSIFDEVSGGFGDLGDVMVWEPAISRARFVGPQLSRGAHDLGSAVGSGVLVSSFAFDGGELTTRLFKLDGGDPVVFPGIDLTRSYVLLEPGYLYNTSDLKFHRVQPSLDMTALPATLATVDGNPTGEYHAIRVLPASGN